MALIRKPVNIKKTLRFFNSVDNIARLEVSRLKFGKKLSENNITTYYKTKWKNAYNAFPEIMDRIVLYNQYNEDECKEFLIEYNKILKQLIAETENIYEQFQSVQDFILDTKKCDELPIEQVIDKYSSYPENIIKTIFENVKKGKLINKETKESIYERLIDNSIELNNLIKMEKSINTASLCYQHYNARCLSVESFKNESSKKRLEYYKDLFPEFVKEYFLVFKYIIEFNLYNRTYFREMLNKLRVLSKKYRMKSKDLWLNVSVTYISKLYTFESELKKKAFKYTLFKTLKSDFEKADEVIGKIKQLKKEEMNN